MKLPLVYGDAFSVKQLLCLRAEVGVGDSSEVVRDHGTSVNEINHRDLKFDTDTGIVQSEQIYIITGGLKIS